MRKSLVIIISICFLLVGCDSKKEETDRANYQSDKETIESLENGVKLIESAQQFQMKFEAESGTANLLFKRIPDKKNPYEDDGGIYYTYEGTFKDKEGNSTSIKTDEEGMLTPDDTRIKDALLFLPGFYSISSDMNELHNHLDKAGLDDYNSICHKEDSRNVCKLTEKTITFETDKAGNLTYYANDARNIKLSYSEIK